MKEGGDELDTIAERHCVFREAVDIFDIDNECLPVFVGCGLHNPAVGC